MFNIIFSISWMIAVIGALYNINRNHNVVYENIDGVTSIDGITYLIVNTDVDHVMYKLSSDCVSRIIKKTTFERISDTEGILKFGGVAYHLTDRSGSDMNIGASYRIKCKQKRTDVVMEISYVGREFRWQFSFKSGPAYAANQAYHRFFKEQFNVKVIQDTER